MMNAKGKSSFFTNGSFICLVILLPLLFIGWHLLSPAASAKPAPGKDPTVPASLLRWPEEGSDYAVLVDKSLQKIFLYHRDNPFDPEKVYACSTGENDGPKTRQNDRRTPEGIYFFTNAFVERDLTPIYGIRAFPINYPNPIDQREGRDGYGIWFHGTNKPLKPRDSNGCVVLENGNIDDLAPYIRLRDTPVIISSRIEMVPPGQVRRDAEDLERIVAAWRKSWAGKDMKAYMGFYGTDFHSGGKNREEWRAYKSRLARTYKTIRVDIDNLRLLRSNGVAMASFHQSYHTAAFHSEGVKQLFFKKNSNQWKIVGEFFDEAGAAMPSRPKEVPSPVEQIRRFLKQWEAAWESRDIDAYMSCYDDRFASRGMDIRSWREHRERLNRKYRSVDVRLEKLRITPASPRKARISFVQDYRADEYRDYGFKEILLVKRGQQWKIREEEWRPLKGRSRP